MAAESTLLVDHAFQVQIFGLDEVEPSGEGVDKSVQVGSTLDVRKRSVGGRCRR
jgi:hypothetical protein